MRTSQLCFVVNKHISVTCVAALLRQRQMPPFRVKSLSVTSTSDNVYRLEMQPRECYLPDKFSGWNTKACA